MQGGTAPGGYDYNAPPTASPYDQTTNGAYPANTGYGMPPAQTGGYPTQPSTAYGAPQDSAAAGYAAAGYNNYPGQAGYGTPGAYGATNSNSAQTGAAVPQTGPYNENYAQQSTPGAYSAAGATGAAGVPGTAGATSAMGATGGATGATASTAQNAAVTPYPASTSNDAYGGSGQVYTNPYAAGTATAAGTAMPAGNDPTASQTAGAYPGTGANPSGGYQTADARGAAGYGTSAAGSEQSAADPYPATGDSTAVAGAAGTGSSATGYQPGNTGYQPGQTGYTPPGSAPYQSPAATNVAATERRDPYYRPGSTSDYTPSGGSQTPAGSTDRYGAPSTAANSADWPSGY